MKRLYVVLCFIVAFSYGLPIYRKDGLAWGADPPRPQIPTQFFTNMTLYEVVQGRKLYFNASYWYDEVNSRDKISIVVQTARFLQQTDNLLLKNTSYLITNGVCRQNPEIKFGPAYSWLRVAKYVGDVVIDGQTTNEWQFNTTVQNANISWTMYSVGDTPVREVLIETFSESLKNILVQKDFFNFKPQPVPDSEFALPQDCFGNGYICGNGTITSIDLFIVHATDDWVWSNRNYGDSLGETALVCFRGSLGHDQLISHIVIQANTSWGQYALCNDNECAGLNLFNIGRESTGGYVSDRGGQCTSNVGVGSWFSLPQAGECSGNVTANCTWFFQQQVKTISGECLTNLSFFDACKADRGFPFTKATQIFNNAFQYDDPSKGGCPPLNQTEITEFRQLYKLIKKRPLSLPFQSSFLPNLPILPKFLIETV